MVPFSHPVTGQNFVNRTELLRKLEFTYVTDNMALVGPRRIGKSSVAKQFLLQIGNDNPFGVYFVDKVKESYKIADHILEIWLRAVYEREEPDLKLIRRKIDENLREFVPSIQFH